MHNRPAASGAHCALVRSVREPLLNEIPLFDTEALRALARASAAIDIACACVSPPPLAWTSMPMALPQTLLERVGTLIVGEDFERGVDEFHPQGTTYWSERAPIAIGWYPANHCEVWRCCDCGRGFLHYTEGGGYFVDRRIRLLDPELIVEPRVAT